MAEPVNILVPESEACEREHWLAGEPVPEQPALAITPVWDDRTGGWSGHWGISHTSGALLKDAYGCLTCVRQAARELAALPIDWPALSDDGHDNTAKVGLELLGKVAAIIRRTRRECIATMCAPEVTR